MRSKFINILILCGIFSIIGLILIFIPFPKSEIITNYENTPVKNGFTYFDRFTYPKLSKDQVIYVNLIAQNGSFNLLVLNFSAHLNMTNELPFTPYFQANNITKVNKTIILNPPNQDQIRILITTDETLMILSGNVITSYLYYITNWGIFSLILGVVCISYLLIQKYKGNL